MADLAQKLERMEQQWTILSDDQSLAHLQSRLAIMEQQYERLSASSPVDRANAGAISSERASLLRTDSLSRSSCSRYPATSTSEPHSLQGLREAHAAQRRVLKQQRREARMQARRLDATHDADCTVVTETCTAGA